MRPSRLRKPQPPRAAARRPYSRAVYELRAPAPDLARFIDTYWFVGADRPEPFDLRVDVFVDGRADLIFNFGAPYHREVIGGPRRRLTRSNLDAQRLVPIRILQAGRLRLAGVRFHLGGLGRFARTPLAASTGTTRAPQVALDRAAVELEAALRDAVGADAQARLLDGFFRAQLTDRPGYDAFARSLARAVADRGAARLGALADAAGTSGRQVERLFARYLGLSPRALARVLRFQDALRMLMRDDARTLAAVAADAGYFDQAHFIRDFRQMTGGVPRGYRGYFPVDGPADFAPNVVAFVQDRADRPRYQRRRTGRAAPRR